MSNELPSFKRAEYLKQPEAQAMLAPEYRYQPITDYQFPVAAAAKPGVLESVSNPIPANGSWLDRKPDSFVMALCGGLAAAIAGCIGYAAFTIITNIRFGLVAAFLGAFIAGAMQFASGGMGGRRYQIAAVVFTYFSISLSRLVQELWYFHTTGNDLFQLSLKAYSVLFMIGVASPFLDLTNLVHGLFGLLFLFIAIRNAWKLSAGKQQIGQPQNG
jgi:hypothetical protein